MICVNNKIRITQSLNGKKHGKFMVYDSAAGELFKINEPCYRLIVQVNYSSFESIAELEAAARKITRNPKDIIQQLFERKLLRMCAEREQNPNILPPLKEKYPLTSLAIEVTQNCNLHCKHCYGQFGREVHASCLSFEYIKSLKPELDRLHTRSIALTGGEVLVHGEFEKIAGYFLENGFELTVFTNGYCSQRLERFLEQTKGYHMSVSISLDGTESVHNKIRGKEDAFQKAMESLRLINKAPNINGGISTVVMRENIEDVQQLKHIVKEQFPNLGQRCKLILPTESKAQRKSAFSKEELEDIYQRFPEVFEMSEHAKKLQYRCAGGIISAALDASKHLKICAAAQGECFWIGDLNEKTLYEAWTKPSDNVRKFRKEKNHAPEKCRRCRLKKKCHVENCRLQAQEYTGDMKNPNPVVCFIEEKKYVEL